MGSAGYIPPDYMANNPESAPSPHDSVQGKQSPADVVPSSQQAANTATSEQGKLPFYHRNKWVIEPVLAVLTLAAALLGVMLWMEDRIDKTVERKLSDEKILRKIASEAQPVLIFNEHGAILFDGGGLEYINDIIIDPKEPFPFPKTILIRPKKFLTQAPLLSSIDGLWFDYTSERKTGLDWEYHIPNYTMNGASGNLNPKTTRFRLEILR